MFNKAETLYIFLDSFLGLEYKNKVKILGLLKNSDKIKEDLLKFKDNIVADIGENAFSTIYSACNNDYVKSVINGLDKRGIVAITKESKNYPKELNEVEFPPLVLYCKGNLDLLKTRRFTIAGSRKTQNAYLKTAEDYAESLIKSGFTIVCGISQGVEEACVRVGVNNGKIICITAGGFDHIYPSNNTDLFNKVAKVGLVISEYPPEFTIKPFNFPMVTRLTAALGEGLLLVSGSFDSGTKHTVEYADSLSKTIFAFPYNLGVKMGELCNYLIKTNIASLTDKPSDIIEYYGLKPVNEVKTEFSVEEQKILDALSEEDLHIDKLINKTGMGVAVISPKLSMLEIKGYVVKNAGNVYSVTAKYKN